MKNENIKTKISLFVFLPFLAVAVFCFRKISFADEKHLILSEILPNPSGSPEKKNEFVEIYNPTDKTIDLADYYLSGKAGTFSLSGNIETKKYKAFYSTITLYNEKSTIKLLKFKTKNVFDISDDEIDVVTYPSPSSKEDYSYSLFLNLSDWAWIQPATPNAENGGHDESEEDPNGDANNNYTGKLKINEIFPAPKTKNAEKEFVEIVNTSDEKIDLFGMWIEDEKNHKVSFPREEVKSKAFFVLEGNFEFNNTSPDTAFLVAKDGTKENPIDSVRYEKPRYDYAYAWNGAAWQWTSYDTKGLENQFDEVLSGKIKKDETIYAGVYANFEAIANDKAKHFTWDFGENHKSYLQKTRHKYERVGTYTASLKITGEGEDNLLSFEVEVKKYGKAKVRIVSLSPNPKGKDSENEWLEIFNNTKKKVNLKGWSVATGLEKLYNHPITKKFILKSGETKKLTRDFCAFALGNKQAKIELRYPNGKVADKIKYDHGNSISEDELYQKENSDWQWTGGTQKTTKESSSDTATESPAEPEIIPTDSAPEDIIEKSKKENVDFDLSDLGKYSEDPAWHAKQKTQTVLLFAKSNIDPEKFLTRNQGQVLGISTTKFSHQNTPITKSSDQFWKKINAKLNQFILLF